MIDFTAMNLDSNKYRSISRYEIEKEKKMTEKLDEKSPFSVVIFAKFRHNVVFAESNTPK